MKLSKLYKRTVHGKVQEWEIEVEGNCYRTITGQQGGKKIVSAWTYVEGKNIGKSNETTPEEQAQAEANAKWLHRASRSYSIVNPQKESPVLPSLIKTPMLAKKWDNHKDKIEYPCAVQPKLDGIRCLHSNVARSREGRKFHSIPHIKDALPERHLFTFDGELYNHDLRNNFEFIVHLARKTKPTPEDLKQSRKYIQYWIYDANLVNDSFEKRWARLQEMEFQYPIILCPTYFVNNESELDSYYQQFLADGYEGIIVRQLGCKYIQGRTDKLLKRKPFREAEFKIVGAVEGKGNRAGTLGKFMCENSAGKQFGVNISKDGGIKHEEMRQMWKERNKYIGKWATVIYQNLTTKNGVPRFGVLKAVRDYE